MQERYEKMMIFDQYLVFISQMMLDRAIVTMEGEYETAPKFSNGTGLNDLKLPLTQISMSRYYSMSNN